MLNLGNEGIEALRSMQSHAANDMTAFRNALHEQMRKAMNAALEADHAVVQHAVGYAKALRDVFMAVEQAALNLKHNEVPKPAPVAKGARDAARQ